MACNVNGRAVDKMERILKELERKREIFEREIIKIQEDMMNTVKNFFEQLTNEINPFLAETEKVVDNCINDSNKMESRRRELEAMKEKLSPVLDMLL